MDQQAATRAGALLWEAWQARRQIDALPADYRPGTLADAYAVQDGLAERAGLGVAGYKIGATNAQVQARFGVDAPFSGRLFADFLGRSPLRVPANAVNFYAIEAEFDFVMGRALAPRDAPYTRDEVGASGRERPPRHRGAGFALHRLALHEGPRPHRRQRHRLHALPRAGGGRRARPRPRGPAGHRPRERRGGERGRGLERPRRPVERHGLARQPPERARPHAGGRPRCHHRQRGRRGCSASRAIPSPPSSGPSAGRRYTSRLRPAGSWGGKRNEYVHSQGCHRSVEDHSARADGGRASRAARRRLPAGRAFRLERVDLRPPDRARAGAGAALPHQPLRAPLRRGDGLQPGQDHAGGRDRGPHRVVGERRGLRHPRRDPQGRGGGALRDAHPLAKGHGGGGAGMRPAPHQPGCDALPTAPSAITRTRARW